MSGPELRLIEPTETMIESYLDFMEDFRAAGEPPVFGTSGVTRENFSDFVRRLQENGSGVNLPEGWVPMTTYWLVRGKRIIGTCNIRHRLSPSLEDFGGHIGYYVRPSERRKGVATQMLAMALRIAWNMEIRRALLTCNSENLASARVIRKNGGELASESYSPRSERMTQRYWITISPE